MADQATDPITEQQEQLAAFTEALQGTEEEKQDDPLLNEEMQDDEQEYEAPEVDEAEDEAGEDEAEQESVEESPKAGPSTEMLAVARLAGVPQSFLDVASSNEQLQTYIEHFSALSRDRKEEPQEEEVQEESALSVSDFIPEDAYDSDDPAHQAVSKLVDVLEKERAETKKTIGLLLQHANAQIQAQQQSEVAQFQKPFDAALDEIGGDALGDSGKGLTSSQIEVRKRAFDTYKSLAENAPPERLGELARLALQAQFPDFVKQPTPVKKKALAKQSAKRRGAGDGRGAPDPVDPVKAFEAELAKLAMAGK